MIRVVNKMLSAAFAGLGSRRPSARAAPTRHTGRPPCVELSRCDGNFASSEQVGVGQCQGLPTTELRNTDLLGPNPQVAWRTP